jgi:hypothetical protein
MTADVGKKRPANSGTDAEAREEQIRRRAYEHYETRGRQEGHDMQDWLRAEAEIDHELRSAA